MKRFYDNTKMSGAFSKALRVLALLCVLLGVSSSAWADIAYLQNPLSLNINDYWHYMKASGHDPIALGEVNTAPTIQDIYVKVGLNTSNNNVCGIRFTIKEGNTMIRDSYLMNNYNKIDNKDTDREYYWTDDIVLPSTTGKHTIELYFWVYGDEGNNRACNETNIYLSNGGSNYKITYTIKGSTSSDKIYVYGDAFGTNDKQECLPTANNPNIVYKELKNWNQWFRFTNSSTDENWEFYKSTEHTKGTSLGVTLGGIPKDGNSLQASNMQENYNTPVFFYYNLSTKEYWLEASKTASYSIEFANGKTYGCYGVSEGTQCGPHVVELGEGTHQFKVKKSEDVYQYATEITKDGITKQVLTNTDAYSTITIPEGEFYSCSFTINDEGGSMKLTVSCTKKEEPILLSRNPVLSNNNKTITLSAYLQKTLCPTSETINQYGFAISSGAGSIPNESSKRIGSSTAPIFRGSDIIYTTGIDNATDRLIGGITYGYRAYVIIDGTLYLSRETYYFRLDGDCIPQAITGPNAVSEVNYTIDASLGEDYVDDCKLIYGSLQKAIDALKATSEKEEEFRYAVKSDIGDDHYTYNLQVPVIFNINYYDDTPDDPSKAYCYEGTNKAKISGGGSSSEESYALIFKDFNREKVGEQKLETLTIKGASGSNRPWLHHVILRNSRNVVLDNLAIFSDPTGERTDDALEFDLNNGSFWDINVNTERDHNILVKNCMIGSNGFTGLHASGYDGITFENNEFEAVMATSKDTWTQNNAIGWGASAKFMMCSNIKFVRNNFRGAHATLVWLQECQNVLFMNNVFWNTNQYNASGCAAIRLVAQYYRDVLNHAYLYNTFYLADNENKNHYNFFKFDLKSGSDGQSGKNENYKTGTIYFKYNNCYSYDEDITGRSDDPFEGLISTINGSENFCPNNFWSVRDQGIYDTKTDAEKVTFKSGFAFGNACDEGSVKQFVNVKELVCATTATGPASLKIKGGGELKSGLKLEASDNFFGTGIKMTADELNYDRYNAAIRPADEAWTLGAYEAQDEVWVKKIYWIGLTDEWDDRNNWGYYPEDVVANSKNQVQMAATRAADMQRLSCVNNLAEKLHVVIPEHPLVQLDGGRKWPKVPEDFTTGRLNYDNGEHVNAGATSGNKGSMFADVIEIEYGAAIKGVEHLTTHYGSAIVHFTAPRDKWILVGTVVEPFDEEKNNGETRKVKSGDYFIQGRTPNVYMHQAEIVDGKPVWNTTFSQLDEEIDANEVFAIMIPNQYGYFKLPAAYYNTDKEENPSGIIYDPAQPIVYGEYEGSREPFQGKLVNDKNENGNYPISFTGLQSGLNLLNNSYPYNIDAKEVERISEKGSIQYFDPDAGEFMNTSSKVGNVILKPQHGFIFTPNSGVPRLDITNEMLDDGNTRSRSAEIELPTFSLNLYNANNNVNYSNAVVRYDEFLGEGNKSNLDVEKAFSPITKTPGLYIIANDGQYSRVDVATTSKAIPLGLRIQEPMIVRFEKSWFSGFSKVTLYDDWTKKEIDLLSKTYTTEELPVGDMEGRFFLYLEEITKEDEELEDDDITTEVEEEITSASEINIFVDNPDNTIKVITNGMELRTIFVSDMAGRTMQFDVRGYAVSLNLPVSQGVYMIHVVGDGGSRTEKVVLK